MVSNILFQECPENDDFLEVPRRDIAFKALKWYPWLNPNCQFCFFVNVQFWMPFARLFVRPNDNKTGLKLVLIGNDINWRTVCLLPKQEP